MSSDKFKPGDRVRKQYGGNFSNGEEIVTVIDIHNGEYEKYVNVDYNDAVWLNTSKAHPTYSYADRLVLVESGAEDEWQTVTQEDADVLNRLGIEYVSRLQIKIKR